MHRTLKLALCAGLFASLWALTALAGDHHWGHYTAPVAPAPPPVCEPGYRIVEETVMQEVTRKVCKQVEEKKKKTVYSCKPQEFCVPNCPPWRHKKCGHPECVDGCPECREAGATMHTKCVLVKKQVDDCPTKKWVVEEVKEVVPVKVYRKVPCGDPAVVPAPGVATPAILPAPATPAKPAETKPVWAKPPETKPAP